MDMKQFFMYESDFIPYNKVYLLNESLLEDLYVTSTDVDKFNVFFHLQNEYFYLANLKKYKEAAYLCYLISYYLFMPLTPPHSDNLAYEYAKKATDLDANPKYQEWLAEVENGN